MNFENLVDGVYSDQNNNLRNSSLLRNIKFISIGLFVICCILLFLIVSRPHKIYFIIEILIFTSIFIIAKYSNSHFFIDEDEKVKKGRFPFISVTMINSSLSIFIIAFTKINIINYNDLYILIPLLTILITAIFIYKNEAFKKISFKHISILLIIVICSFLSSLGAFVYVNCHYDKSESKIYYAKIKDKVIREDEGSYEYFFFLGQWGNILNENRIDVKREFYNHYNISDSIPLYYRKGLFGINWYSIEDNIQK